MSTPARGSRRTSRSTDGRITYVGPREPSGDVDRCHAARCWCRATSSRTRTRGACTRRRRCSRSPCPTGRRRSSTTTCSSTSSHGVDGLRQIVDAMNDAPAHIRWVARLAPQTAYADDRFPVDVIARMLSWPEVVASGEITNWSAAARGEFAAGHRGREGGAAAGRGPQRGRVVRPARGALAGRHLLRPRGDHGRRGAAPAAARDVDDAAQLLAAAGPGDACCASWRR